MQPRSQPYSAYRDYSDKFVSNPRAMSADHASPHAEGAPYLEHILRAVQQPHLRHYVEGLWLQPLVRVRITSPVAGQVPAASIWRAVCRVKDNPWAQADVHDLAIAVTVMTGLRTLLYGGTESQLDSSDKESDRARLQKVLVHSSTASLLALCVVDPRNHGLLMQTLAFQNTRKSVQLSGAQAEFQARLQTLVLLAWAHCDAEQDDWEARP